MAEKAFYTSVLNLFGPHIFATLKDTQLLGWLRDQGVDMDIHQIRRYA